VSDKARWAGIYLLICLIPLFIYFLPPLSPEIMSHKMFTNFLVLAPYLGLFLIAILGWQVNQTRIFWSSLLLVGIYHFFIHSSEFFDLADTRARSIEIITVAYPLSLSILFVMRESQLWSDKSLTRVLLGLWPFLIFVGLYNWAPNIYQGFFFLAPWNNAQLFHIPTITLIAYLIFLLVVIFEPEPKPKSYLIALGASSIPFLFCTQISLINNASPLPAIKNFHIIVAFSVMTAILLHAILRMYWQKVYLDILTEVPNRQALDERLITLQHPYALAMIDIDHFKKFNDNYGHAEGDNVLRMVALTLQESLGERVYRYGGEEFCAIFEGEEAEKAHLPMEQARKTLDHKRFHLRQLDREKPTLIKKLTTKGEPKLGKEIQITISVGVAYSTPKTKYHHDVIHLADKSLYKAKERGRNQVVSSEDKD
jgi:diguanylate cyclase (GGDEF)-like protein